jgi:MFS family permease
VCIFITLRAVPEDEPRAGRAHVDISGSLLFCVALVGAVFGLSQTQDEPFNSSAVFVPVAVAAVAIVLFVIRERRAHNPLMSFSLLAHHRNYLGATLSQGIAGIAEMGLGVIFPILLILNLGMSPVVAGLALIPTTVPMIFLGPIAGRWYDRAGGRPPLVVGFGVLAASGVALALGIPAGTYVAILPGLLLYGVGLALVLTTNDPVSLDSIEPSDSGQASGVSATAEQGGGAFGIAVLYALFHTAYVDHLHESLANSPLANTSDQQLASLREHLLAAEQTGLQPDHFDPKLLDLLVPAAKSAQYGYQVTFLAMAAIAVIGVVVTAWLVRRPADQTQPVARDDQPSGEAS